MTALGLCLIATPAAAQNGNWASGIWRGTQLNIPNGAGGLETYKVKMSIELKEGRPVCMWGNKPTKDCVVKADRITFVNAWYCEVELMPSGPDSLSGTMRAIGNGYFQKITLSLKRDP
jgi:hypothetical protein